MRFEMTIETKPPSWDAALIQLTARRVHGVELAQSRAQELAEELEPMTSRLLEIRGRLNVDDAPWIYARIVHGLSDE